MEKVWKQASGPGRGRGDPGPGPVSQVRSSGEHLHDSAGGPPLPAAFPPPVLGPGLAGGLLSPDTLRLPLHLGQGLFPVTLGSGLSE